MSAAKLVFNPLTIADIPDHAENNRTTSRTHRAQTDLYRKFGAIATPPIEIEACAHTSELGLGMEICAMLMVPSSLALWHEHLDPLPDQLVSCVPEQRFRLGVDLDDDPVLIHGGDGVGDCFQNRMREQGLGESVRVGLHIPSRITRRIIHTHPPNVRLIERR